jgi:dihydropyrimidine dehydrogenase (NAD+) subunit PreA
MIERAFQLGWAGAVTKSVSLAQDLPDHSLSPRFGRISRGGSSLTAPKLIGMTNIDFRIDKSVQDTLDDYARVKNTYPNKFLAVSIKAEYEQAQWHKLASLATATGADAIELCLSCPDPSGEEGCCTVGSIGQNRQAVKEVVTWVWEVTPLPVMVKLSGNVTSILTTGLAAQEAGAAALTAINTLRSITGINLATSTPLPTISGRSTVAGLSGPAIKPIAQFCVYELGKEKTIRLPISAAGGITCAQDAMEFLLLGATTVQVATEIMYEGFEIIEDLKDGLQRFMAEHGFETVKDLVGTALPKFTQSSQDLSRQQQLKSNVDPDECIGCGRCYVACRDGAYQAISFSAERTVQIDSEKCVGCGLCKLTCPVPAAIYFTAGEERAEGLF